MKTKFLLAVGAVGAILSSPAYSLECTKTLASTDKLICAYPKLKSADDAMSATYFKLLRETTDPDFHEALIRSQRRWLKVRSGGPDRYGAAEGDETPDAEVLLLLTRNRLNYLRTAQPIHIMDEQRQITLNASGGPFAGYRVSCMIVPPPYADDWSYECWGEEQQQNGERVCSVMIEWASGHTTDHRLVSVLKDGEPKPVPSCSIGYADTSEQCPDRYSVAEDQHWNTNPQPSEDLHVPRAHDLWKYDPDVEPHGEWMRDCLSAHTYPPPEVSRSDPVMKK